MSGLPKHLEQWQEEAVLLHHMRMEEERHRLDCHGFAGDIEGLCAYLAHRYGSSARGWRLAIAFDKDDARPVPFNRMCAGLRNAGFGGNALTLWGELVKEAAGATRVGLQHLEPHLAEDLDLITEALVEKFPGGAAQAWRKIKRTNALRMTYEEFQNFLTEEELLGAAGDVPVEARRVFAALDLSGRGAMTRSEFMFLDQWAYRRQKFQPREPGPVREEPTWELPELPTVQSRAPPPGLVAFRDHLEARYGTPARAWRVAMDLKGTGAITAAELKDACRLIGWDHPHMSLWRELKEAGGGQVTVRALDPDTSVAVDALREVVRAAYFDDSTLLWENVLDPEGTGVVSYKEFVMTIGEELQLGMEAAHRIFCVLDAADTGWLASCEFDYLELFGSGTNVRRASNKSRLGSLGSTRQGQSMSGSMNHTRSDGFRLPWGEEGSVNQSQSLGHSQSQSLKPELGFGLSQSQFSRASFSPKSTFSMSATRQQKRPPIWSSANSTRSAQQRSFHVARSVKHRWLHSAVADRCKSSSIQLVKAEQETMLMEWQTRQHPQIFKTTHNFYREGVRKMKQDFEASRKSL